MSAENDEIDRDAALALLSDDERAAIADDGLDEDEKSALQEIVEDDEDGEDEKAPEEDGDEAADKEEGDKEDDASGEAGDPPASPPEGKDEKGQDTTLPRAVYRSNVPEGFIDRVKALEEAEASIAKKFDGGEIEAQEYAREVRRLMAERSEVDRIRIKAEVAAEMSHQAAVSEWQMQVASFLREAKQSDGIDYQANEVLAADLDTVVKALANNPAHADMSGAWFLQQAHKAVKAMHGISETKQPAPAVKAAAPSRKPPVDKVPKTLAQVPGGDGPGDVGDEFADIDKLEGEAYERALSRLTPAQRERYLASA